MVSLHLQRVEGFIRPCYVYVIYPIVYPVIISIVYRVAELVSKTVKKAEHFPNDYCLSCRNGIKRSTINKSKFTPMLSCVILKEF